jgi:uncharacterized protein (TIGR02217 family)
MSITVYADVIVPDTLMAAGVRGRQMRRNVRAQMQSGQMQVNVGWANTLRQYEFGFIPLLQAQWQTLEGLFEVTDAGAYGMLLQDPKDTTVAATAGLLYPYTTALVGAIGVGYGVPAYKMYKRYSAAGTTRTKDRAITRPQATPTLKRGGVMVTLGAAPGNAAIDYNTGTATFVADSSSTVTAVTVGATTQVTLTAALAGLSIGMRLYLLGLTGADAALLNGLSHAISNITGGGSNVYTLSTNTVGKTITAAGSGYKYPQASETMTWGGALYVPVHFANDEIDWEQVASGAEATQLLAGPSVLLQEVRE